MSSARWIKSVFWLFLILAASRGFGSAQPVLIAPVPCEALAVTATDETSPWIDVDVENRTDKTLHLYRSVADGFKETGVLKARYAERFWGKPGSTWQVKDDAGKCLAGYVTGKQYGRIKIGDQEL